MPRTARHAPGGLVYHVLNRGNDRRAIFRKDADYAVFLDVLRDAHDRADVELFAYCLMPDHWHLVLRPARDGDLARYLAWVTNTHVKRYRAHHPRTSGHLYQGRYKSFPVQGDAHLLTLLRYVEANAVRPTLAARAQDWPWSSATAPADIAADVLSPWPVDRPSHWLALLNRPARDAAATTAAIRTCIARGRPFGDDAWVAATAKRLHLGYTLRPRGRPPKAAKAAAAPVRQARRGPA